MNSKQQKTGKKELLQALSSIDNSKEMESFLGDILTPQEFENLIERWMLIKLLLEGKTQREVRDELGVAIATVTRGSRQLQYGTGAFKKIINPYTNS